MNMEKSALAMSSPDQPPPHPEFTPEKVKRVISVCLFLTAVAGGIANAVPNFYLSPLSLSSGIPISSLTWGFVASGVSYILTALIYGLLAHRMNRGIVMQTAFLASGIAFFATPMIHKCMYQFISLKVIDGLCSALIDVSTHAWILELWKEKKSAPYLMALYFMMRFGSFTGSISNLAIHGFQSKYGGDAGEIVKMRFAYKLSATAMILAAAIMTILYGTRKYVQNNRTVKQGKDHEGDGQPEKVVTEDGRIEIRHRTRVSMSNKVIYILIGTALAAIAGSTEVLVNTFIMPYLMMNSFSMSELAAMMQAKEGTMALALLLTSLITMKVNVKHVLLAVTPLLFTGNMLLLLCTAGSPNGVMTWAGDLVQAMGAAVMLPGTFALMEEKVNVTNTVVGVVLSVMRLFQATLPMVMSHFFERNNRVFLYVSLGSIPSVVALIVMAYIMGKRMK